MSVAPAWLLLALYHLVVVALFVLSAALPVIVVWLLYLLDLGGSSRGDLLLALPVVEGVLLYVYAQAALFALSVRRGGVPVERLTFAGVRSLVDRVYADLHARGESPQRFASIDLTPDCQAHTALHRGRPHLSLGWVLLRELPEAHRTAILAHEYAHQADGRMTMHRAVWRILATNDRLVEAADGMIDRLGLPRTGVEVWPQVFKKSAGFAARLLSPLRLFTRVIQRMGRGWLGRVAHEYEFACDRVAARLTSPECMSTALLACHVLGERWRDHCEGATEAITFAGFAAAQRTDDTVLQALDGPLSRAAHSHPSFVDRCRRLGCEPRAIVEAYIRDRRAATRPVDEAVSRRRTRVDGHLEAYLNGERAARRARVEANELLWQVANRWLLVRPGAVVDEGDAPLVMLAWLFEMRLRDGSDALSRLRADLAAIEEESQTFIDRYGVAMQRVLFVALTDPREYALRGPGERAFMLEAHVDMPGYELRHRFTKYVVTSLDLRLPAWVDPYANAP